MLKLIISEKSNQLSKFFEYVEWSNKQQEPTYLLCYNGVKIRAKYNELIQVLGNPSMIKPHHKTYSEWVFTIIDESCQIVFLTLYDYKDAYYYGHDENKFKDELIEWHFGSTLSQVKLAEQICEELNSELKELRTNTPNNSLIKSENRMERGQQQRIDMVRHYWFKGYIRNCELFQFLEPLMYRNYDVFTDSKYLKKLVRGCFASTNAFRYNHDENFVISSDVVPEEQFNNLWKSEFRRLNALIGTKKTIQCDNCGKPAHAEIKLMNESNPKYDVSAGRIYWERSCNYCHNFDDKYSEVE